MSSKKNKGVRRHLQTKGGITIKILGDFEPFSKMGKSIGYQVTIGEANYLIDCGAPLFQQIGSLGLDKINGIIITHCHDDHKRWFTDLSLFKMYKPQTYKKVHLLTSEDVMAEIARSSGPALDRSLSVDSKRIVDISFEEYIDCTVLGPKARYRIVEQDEGDGCRRLVVVDENNAIVGPDRAKVVINPKTRRARMLFRDPDYNEWIEPESFYAYSSTGFYESTANPYHDAEGFMIRAIKAPVWHGIPSIGLSIQTADEFVTFSSDTAHDRSLWKELADEKRPQQLRGTRKEFEKAAVIYGDINDYIERTWSRERLEEAQNTFREGIVIHDVASKNSVVHTDYEKLHLTNLEKDRTILTHSPDTITSEWVLSDSDKTFRIKGNEFFEVVGDAIFEMNADIYHRTPGHYFVGYRSENGGVIVYRKDGLLGLSEDGVPEGAEQLYRVDIYEDIGGRYYPKLDSDSMAYFVRKDGKVELVELGEHGSSGKIVESIRDRLVKISV